MTDMKRLSDKCEVIGNGRILPSKLEVEKRLTGFEEVENTFSIEEAVSEASRCAASNPCLYCEVCQLMCPDLAITRDENGRIQIDLDYCKGCGLCAIYCPKGAIKMVVEEQV